MAGGPHAVDVVMVTWNKRDLTRRAIESFRRHVRHPYRLICVDNGSTDGTLEDVREAADLLITASANLGAVRGRNLGWTATTTDYVLFVDNDIEFCCDVVGSLVAAMEREPRLGIVGPLQNETLRTVGLLPEGLSLQDITSTITGAASAELQDVHYVQACAMLVRREMVADIGAFDTAFDPYGHEEYDMAQRARARGWRVELALDSYVHHHGTGARALPEREALVERNRQTFLRRWSVTTDGSLLGIVKPFTITADHLPAPAPRLGDHIKLLERSVAACVPDADWVATTQRFVGDLPVMGDDVAVVGCRAGDAVRELRHRYGRRAVGVSVVVNGDATYGVRQGYGFALPFEDESFDAVVTRHSLEHSPMPLIDLLETARVLRPGGLAVLAVPGPLAAGAPSALYAPLSDAQWRRLIEQSGLVLREVRGTPTDAGIRYVASRSAA